ncbi:MAG: hypothetical protein N3B13_07640 [Deltaproteobacteria bacterium]|nr:hypothetical protein [Deltaproteobacteria bacterium]
MPGNRTVNNIIFELQQEIRNILSEIMKEGIHNGDFIEGNSNAVSAIMLGVMEGTMLQWRVRRDAVDLKELYNELKKIIRLFERNKFLQGVSYGEKM